MDVSKKKKKKKSLKGMKTNSMYANIVLCLTVDGKHQTQVKAAVKHMPSI